MPSVNVVGQAPKNQVTRSNMAVKPCFNEDERKSQYLRLSRLRLQDCDKAAIDVYRRAKQQIDRLEPGVRIDLPSTRVLSSILAVFRCGAAIKNDAMLHLELSARELALRTKYSKSTIEAALRWLRPDPIRVKGKIVAHGLGIIQCQVRKGIALVGDHLMGVYRTSIRSLTVAGMQLLDVTNDASKMVRIALNTVWTPPLPAPVVDEIEPTEYQPKEGEDMSFLNSPELPLAKGPLACKLWAARKYIVQQV